MKKLMTAVITIALVVSGCRFSKVKADAAITVSGRALDAHGVPLAGAKVRLFKEADLGEAVIGVVLAVGSLGSVCLLPEAPAICRQARVATTGPDGRYTFELKGSDTQGTIGTESTLDVVVADPRARGTGASTTISFKARSATVSLPDARLWNAAPRLAEGAGRIRLTWSALPAGYGHQPSYAAQLFDPARQGALWSQPGKNGRADIDARVLEDRSATAAVAARATVGGTSDVHASYLSSRLAVKPIAGPPPSRHRACLTVVGTAVSGNSTASAQRACRVTDGDPVTAARLAAANAQVVTGVVVDLGGSRPIHLVVARGLAGQFLVELSSDGVSYRTVATGSGSAAAFSPPGEPSARFVRLRSPSGLDQSLMTEVSVW